MRTIQAIYDRLNHWCLTTEPERRWGRGRGNDGRRELRLGHWRITRLR